MDDVNGSSSDAAPEPPEVGAVPAAAGSDDDQFGADLDASLVALSQLSADRLKFEDLMARVAEFALRAIPGADGAGLTLLEPDRPGALVKSAEFVRQLDDLQYRLGEGPCISAALQGETMRSGSLAMDARWPRFGPRAGRLGVHSVLSLPLTTPAGVVGAMNIYAHGRDAFDDRAAQAGEVFAGPAAVTVHNAQILAQTVRLAAQLQRALSTRPAIEQAIGVLRARSGVAGSDALQRLRLRSRNEHLPLSDVGEHIVEEAVRRAQSRNLPAD